MITDVFILHPSLKKDFILLRIVEKRIVFLIL
jgi:hypothetical protein